MQLFRAGKLDHGDWEYMEYMIPDFIAALNAVHPPVANLAGHRVSPSTWLFVTYLLQ